MDGEDLNHRTAVWGTLFKLCEIRQYRLRQPLQIQTTPVAADETDVSAVFGLQKRDGRRHFVHIRQGFGRQEGIIDGVEQQQRTRDFFEPRFARGAAVIVETVGKTMQRRGKRIVEVAQRFALFQQGGNIAVGMDMLQIGDVVGFEQ